jgi:CheY-like chemotaxis protein
MTKRILCIGERPENLALVRDILEDEGYETLLRATPFHDRMEIEALHPDLIMLTVTAVADCLGRQTLRVLNRKSEAVSPPVLVWVRAAEDILPQDRDLMSEQISFIRIPLLDSTTLLNSIQQALQTSPR